MGTFFDKIIEEVFVKWGVLGLIACALVYLIYRLVNKIIEDKDTQIKELAKENREYRERFTVLIDKHFATEEEGINT